MQIRFDFKARNRMGKTGMEDSHKSRNTQLKPLILTYFPA